MGKGGEFGERIGTVDEGVIDGAFLQHEVERVGIVVLEDKLAIDGELRGSFGKVDVGDAIAIDVTHPMDVVTGRYLHDGAFDVDVMAFARPDHDFVLTKLNRGAVGVSGTML